MRWWLLIALLVALAGCSADPSKPAGSGSSAARSPAAPSPAYDGAAYAKQVSDAVLSGLSNDQGMATSFADMCSTPVAWACAIAKIESESPGSVKVTLQPEQMWISKTTERDWYKFGEQVARGVYNFAEAAGEPEPGGGWRKLVKPPSRVDVYQSNGELAYMSPMSFPGR